MANALSFRGYPIKASPRNPAALDGSRLLRHMTTGGQLPPNQGTPLGNPNDFRLPGVGVGTGGPLPPTPLTPLQNPNDFRVPNVNVGTGTGPAITPAVNVNTGGPLPPQQGVPLQNPNDFRLPAVNVGTGGGSALTPQVAVNTGGQLPPQQGVPLQNPNDFMVPNVNVNTGGPLPPSQVAMPALDGSRFVASTTGAGPGASAMDTIGQMAQQFAYQPGASATSVAQQIAAQFNVTPDQLPIEVVQQINAAFAQAPRDSASATAMGYMDDLLSTEGSYITNARRRGLEQANSRGLLNSSVAAGASQRAALDAAQPIFSEIMGLNNQREAQDFQATMASRNLAGEFAGMDRQAIIERGQQAMALAGQLEGQDREAALAQARDAFSAATQLSGQREQNAFAGLQAGLDRTQGVNDALLGYELDARRATLDAQLRSDLQSDTTLQQDWLSDRQFTREFNGALSTMAIGGAYDLNNAILNYAASNPEVYTPEIISGMTNFFQMNMTGLLQQYFPQLAGGNG